jgi:hypothetical protein
MGQEDKELLLKDLCARLPYNCRVFYEYIDNLDNKTYGYSLTLNTWCIDEFIANKAVIKPYLRPISSMTDEEKGELKLEQEKDEELFIQVINKSQNGDDSLLGTVIPHYAEDWANKNHFDYRGLIEKGLALEAPEGMYNLKEKV